MAENAAEKLAREIRRVAKLQSFYESMDAMPQIVVKPAISMMDQALDHACRAAGTNDAVEVLQAIRCLEGFEK